jgi:hypothetical protein
MHGQCSSHDTARAQELVRLLRVRAWPAAKEKALKERRVELRLWRAWRRERLDSILAGAHGDAAQALVSFLKTAPAPTTILEFITSGPWTHADSETRAEVLALVDTAIIRRREKMELPPFDDALKGEANLFLRIRDLLFPLNGGATRGEARS